MKRRRDPRKAFTLVEVLIAATLSLVLIGLVVQIFATVGATASETRSVIQIIDGLRTARIIMQADLSNTTAEMLPLKIDRADGYFEYVEGPNGPIFPGLGASPIAVAYDMNQTDTAGAPVADSTVGDTDDILMFTAQAPTGSYFHGRTRSSSLVLDQNGKQWPIPCDSTAQASQAEICYFMRGDTLYRRVLLINPTAGVNGVIDPTVFLCSQYPQSLTNPADSYVKPTGTNTWSSNPSPPQPIWDIAFYDKFDLSVHQEGGVYDLTTNAGGFQPPVLVANTLAALAKRQYRYGHQPWVYPFDVRFWDTRQWTNPATNVPGGFLGLPTLRECTAYLGALGAGSGIAIWPYPLYDNPTAATALKPLPNGVSPGASGVAVQNLWGSAQPSNMPMLPYSGLPLIYPFPTGAYPATYQPISDVPASPTGRLWLTAAKGGVFDLWRNPYPLDQQDPLTGAIYAFSSAYQPANTVNVNFSTRYADDVLLTHVLSFDVKAWDPTAPTIQTTAVIGGMPPGTYMPGDLGYVQIINAWASGGEQVLRQSLLPVTASPTPGFTVAQGAYVDLNYLGAVIQPYLAAGNIQMTEALSNVSVFSGPGIAQFSSGLGMLYDTGSFSYENDGIDQNMNGIIDDYTNGIDDNGIGGVDDLTEVEGPVPYPVALKGIQVKIRVYDPDSRQIREVTLTQDFLGE